MFKFKFMYEVMGGSNGTSDRVSETVSCENLEMVQAEFLGFVTRQVKATYPLMVENASVWMYVAEATSEWTEEIFFNVMTTENRIALVVDHTVGDHAFAELWIDNGTIVFNRPTKKVDVAQEVAAASETVVAANTNKEESTMTQTTVQPQVEVKEVKNMNEQIFAVLREEGFDISTAKGQQRALEFALANPDKFAHFLGLEAGKEEAKKEDADKLLETFGASVVNHSLFAKLLKDVAGFKVATQSVVLHHLVLMWDKGGEDKDLVALLFAKFNNDRPAIAKALTTAAGVEMGITMAARISAHVGADVTREVGNVLRTAFYALGDGSHWVFTQAGNGIDKLAGGRPAELKDYNFLDSLKASLKREKKEEVVEIQIIK